MSKTILIPTDFKVESLNTLKLALNNSQGDIEVILIHSEFISDSITELLFYSPEKTINTLMKPEYEKALAILKNRFEKILKSIGMIVLNGHSMPMLEKVLKAYKVDEIYIPKRYKLKPTDNSFDPLPLLRRSNLPVHEMDWDLKNNNSEQDQLNTLFN